MSIFIPGFTAAVVFFADLTLIGTIGYQLIEGWSAWHSLGTR